MIKLLDRMIIHIFWNKPILYMGEESKNPQRLTDPTSPKPTATANKRWAQNTTDVKIFQSFIAAGRNITNPTKVERNPTTVERNPITVERSISIIVIATKNMINTIMLSTPSIQEVQDQHLSRNSLNILHSGHHLPIVRYQEDQVYQSTNFPT